MGILEKYICPRKGIGFMDQNFKKGDVIVRHTFSGGSGSSRTYYTFEEATTEFKLTNEHLAALRNGKVLKVKGYPLYEVIGEV